MNKFLLKVLAVVLALTMVAACAPAPVATEEATEVMAETQPAAEVEVFKIGAMAPMTGDVAFLGENRPQEQSTGDTEWDNVALTYAPSPLDAVRAVTPSLRKLLMGWSFEGHLELKHGGLLLHLENALPVPSDCERVLNWIPSILEKALKEKR